MSSNHCSSHLSNRILLLRRVLRNITYLRIYVFLCFGKVDNALTEDVKPFVDNFLICIYINRKFKDILKIFYYTLYL